MYLTCSQHPVSYLTIQCVPSLLIQSTILFFGLITAGCGWFNAPAIKTELKPDQTYWFDYDAYRRGAFLIVEEPNATKKIRMCAEPPPDVALTRTQDFLAKVGYQGVSADVQAKIAEQLAELSGRTQTVLLIRESLFRLCELSISSALDSAKIELLYEKVLDAMTKLAAAEETKAQATKSRAEEKKAMAETDKINAIRSLTPEAQKLFQSQ